MSKPRRRFKRTDCFDRRNQFNHFREDMKKYGKFTIEPDFLLCFWLNQSNEGGAHNHFLFYHSLRIFWSRGSIKIQIIFSTNFEFFWCKNGLLNYKSSWSNEFKLRNSFLSCQTLFSFGIVLPIWLWQRSSLKTEFVIKTPVVGC